MNHDRVRGAVSSSPKDYHHPYRLSRIRPLGFFRFKIYFLKFTNPFGQLIGLLGRGMSPMQGLYVHTGQRNTEKRGHTSMPRVGFEFTVPLSERPKTVLQTAGPLAQAPKS